MHENRETLENLMVEDLAEVINKALGSKMERAASVTQVKTIRNTLNWKKVKFSKKKPHSTQCRITKFQAQHKALETIVYNQARRISALEKWMERNTQAAPTSKGPKVEFHPVPNHVGGSTTHAHKIPRESRE
jgi:hypothetical protein